MRTLAAPALLSTVIGIACKSSTAPGVGGGAGGAGHPQGALVATPAIASRPFAVAVSPGSVVFVGRQDLPFLQTTTLPGLDFADSVRVGADPTDIALNTAGTRAYVTNQFSRNLGMIDVATRTSTDSLAIPGSPFRVLVAPGDASAYVSSSNDSVYAVSTSSRTIVGRWGFNGPVNGLAVSSDGASLYVTTISGQLGRITTATGASDAVTIGGVLQDVVVLGGDLFIAVENGTIQVRNAGTLAAITTIPLSNAFGLKASPDGLRIYATIPGTGTIGIVDPSGRRVMGTLYVGGVPRRIGFSPDGANAFIGNEGGVVDVIR